jgi:hypothetical protein
MSQAIKIVMVGKNLPEISSSPDLLRSFGQKRRRAAAVQDRSEFKNVMADAKRFGVRQPSGAFTSLFSEVTCGSGLSLSAEIDAPTF